MIEWVAPTPQSEEPCPCWKMKTMIPNAAASESEVQHDRLDRQHDRAERPREQDQRQEQDERRARRGSCRTARAGSRGRWRRCRSACRSSLRGSRWRGRRSPGCRERRRRSSANASTNEFGPRCHPGGAVAPTTPGTARSFAATCCALPPCSTRTFERLHHAGADPRRGELVAAGDRRAGAGEVLQLRLVRVQLRPEAREHGDDHQADGGDRDRAAEHEARPATPGAVFGMAAGR